MICKVCGRTTENENANFCEYCGSSFREMASQPVDPVAAEKAVMWGQQTRQQAQQQPQGMNGGDKPITMWSWLLILVLPLIPGIGMFAFLIMLCLWAFGRQGKEDKNKRNFARAMLIVVGIAIVYLFVMSFQMANDFINSGLSWGDYMNQIMDSMTTY